MAALLACGCGVAAALQGRACQLDCAVLDPLAQQDGISELGVARGLFGLAYFLHGAEELAALFSLGTVFGGIGCVELRHALASPEVWTLLCDSVQSVSLVVTLTLLMHVGRPLALHRCMHP